MPDPHPRTEYVRRRIHERAFEPARSYADDLLDLERLLTEARPGFAGSMALGNLVSRYPTEADAIVRELGLRPFAPFEETRIEALLAERLRLAERRHPLGRLTDEPRRLFEW